MRRRGVASVTVFSDQVERFALLAVFDALCRDPAGQRALVSRAEQFAVHRLYQAKVDDDFQRVVVRGVQ